MQEIFENNSFKLIIISATASLLSEIFIRYFFKGTKFCQPPFSYIISGIVFFGTLAFVMTFLLAIKLLKIF